MSKSGKTKRSLIVFIVTLSGLIIFISRTKHSIRDDRPKFNQSLKSHLERRGQFSEKYNQKSKDLQKLTNIMSNSSISPSKVAKYGVNIAKDGILEIEKEFIDFISTFKFSK